MGRSTSTTAFDGTILYIAYTMKTHMHEGVWFGKIIFDKMTAVRI